MSDTISHAIESQTAEGAMRVAIPHLATSHFATLRHPVSISGVGLHCGQNVHVELHPRQTVGIVFVRVDCAGAPEIVPHLDHVARTTHATTLECNGLTVGTTEHLLAALWAAGVTHCRIELDGPEVPILDGSAQPWCVLINEAGLQPVLNGLDSGGQRTLGSNLRPIYVLREPICIYAGSACVFGLPHSEFRLSVAVEYATEWPSRQSIDMRVDTATFADELAPARTFTLQEWVDPLRAQGLIRGGSPDNALVLDENGPSSPWRLENELARHKALDVVGDLALLFASNGGALRAHIVAIKAGHEAHRAWMHECRLRDALVLEP